MTRLLILGATLLLVSVVSAQTPDSLSPSTASQSQQPVPEGYDIAIGIAVEEPPRGIAPQAGPLVINATFDTSVTPARQTVLQQAINEWQAIVRDSGSTPGSYPISFRFSATDPSCQGNCLALTLTSFNATTGNLISASMVFNTGRTFFEDPNPADDCAFTGGCPPPPAGSFDLLTLARHEIGHALGWTSSPRVTNLVTMSAFNPPRLNIPIVTATGMHTDPTWKPNDFMTPLLAPVTRQPISLYPGASLVARAYGYDVPMQYVDPTHTLVGGGTAANPWSSFGLACALSPDGMPLLLANVTHTVANGFTCGNPPVARRHVIDAARGGAVVRP